MIRDSDDYDDHDKVLFVGPQVLGVPAVIALHRSVEGRSGGGVRFHPYLTEEQALADALRLSRAMSYKLALAGIPIGGGKAVLTGDPHTEKSDDVLRRLARLIDSLGGAYIAGPDVGTSTADMAVLGQITDHVIGVPGRGPDTSGPTATGVLYGLRATGSHVLGASTLHQVTIAVQGLGSVGRQLCRLLAGEGAALIVADIDESAVAAAVAETGATAVRPDEILSAPADIVVPCALGGVLNKDTIPQIKARAVCGPANNQLATSEDADRLRERDITFAPDYVVSSGGSISAAVELGLLSSNDFEQKVAGIGTTLIDVFQAATVHAITPHAAAQRLAEMRLAASASPSPGQSMKERAQSRTIVTPSSARVLTHGQVSDER